jgi:hypothetical protein
MATKVPTVKKTVTKWVEPEMVQPEPTVLEIITNEINEIKIKVVNDEATDEEIEKLKLLTL